MKVVILAGGYGTRLAEYTSDLPKPMVSIGGNPILWHIMNIYAGYGHKEFFIALGYKAEIIKDFFVSYKLRHTDFTLDLSTGETEPHQSRAMDWKVTLIDTGLDSMTGSRVKKMQKYLCGEPCLLTYGDGVSDVDIKSLIDFHKSHGKMVTVTAVRPMARFGELQINKSNQVQSFKEKPQTELGWINGGYFVVEPEFFDLLSNNESLVLEKEPLEMVAKMGELVAYKHTGFWQCMDTKRDRDYLDDLISSGQAPWVR